MAQAKQRMANNYLGELGPTPWAPEGTAVFSRYDHYWQSVSPISLDYWTSGNGEVSRKSLLAGMRQKE